MEQSNKLAFWSGFDFAASKVCRFSFWNASQRVENRDNCKMCWCVIEELLTQTLAHNIHFKYGVAKFIKQWWPIAMSWQHHLTLSFESRNSSSMHVNESNANTSHESVSEIFSQARCPISSPKQHFFPPVETTKQLCSICGIFTEDKEVSDHADMHFRTHFAYDFLISNTVPREESDKVIKRRLLTSKQINTLCALRDSNDITPATQQRIIKQLNDDTNLRHCETFKQHNTESSSSIGLSSMKELRFESPFKEVYRARFMSRDQWHATNLKLSKQQCPTDLIRYGRIAMTVQNQKNSNCLTNVWSHLFAEKDSFRHLSSQWPIMLYNDAIATSPLHMASPDHVCLESVSQNKCAQHDNTNFDKNILQDTFEGSIIVKMAAVTNIPADDHLETEVCQFCGRLFEVISIGITRSDRENFIFRDSVSISFAARNRCQFDVLDIHSNETDACYNSCDEEGALLMYHNHCFATCYKDYTEDDDLLPCQKKLCV